MQTLVSSLRRLAKEALVWIGGASLLRWLWTRQGRIEDLGHLAHASRARRFSEIYKSGTWFRNSPEAPSSGPGSSLASTTTMRKDLPDLLDRLEAKSLLDVGCGDFTWMAQTAIRQQYEGVDIVESVIAENRARHASPGIKFTLLDICHSTPPYADVALCREILFHLSSRDALRAFRNLRRARIPYLLATTDPQLVANIDIMTGDFHEVNLEIRPYRLGAPIFAIPDAEGPNPRRFLGVWRLTPSIT